jgi:hypothetical protein
MALCMHMGCGMCGGLFLCLVLVVGVGGEWRVARGAGAWRVARGEGREARGARHAWWAARAGRAGVRSAQCAARYLALSCLA